MCQHNKGLAIFSNISMAIYMIKIEENNTIGSLPVPNDGRVLQQLCHQGLP